MAFAIRGEITGLADVLATLRGLPAKLQRQVLRAALEKAAKPVLDAARRNLDAMGAVEARLLKRSLGRKTVTYPETGTVVVIVGPRSGFQATVTRPAAPAPHRHGARTGKADPVFYAHLVEKGTRPHALGRGARLKGTRKRAAVQHGGLHSGARAKPFLETAWAQMRVQAERTLRAEVAAGIERELTKS